MATKSIPEVISEAREAFNSNITKNLNFRKKQLKNLLKLLSFNKVMFQFCLKQDLQKPEFESELAELTVLKNDIRGMISNLEDYCAPEKVKRNLTTIIDEAFILREPYGVVLIIGAWNYPLVVLLGPLIGAIAAGNTAILKPSELSPATAKALQTLLPRYLDSRCYHVVNGGPDICQSLLNHKFDYIMFTGNSKVGKIVNEVAARNLTPVTLELGGKNPIYMDETVTDMYSVCKRIIWGKMLNAGQTCISPDYLLCTKEVQEKFVVLARKVIEEFYKNGFNDLSKIVNEIHFKRLLNIINKTCGDVVISGSIDEENCFIGPTVITNITNEDFSMTDEVFGPILLVLPVTGIDEAIEIIQSRPKPLSLYIFSSNKKRVNRLLSETSSGNVCVNDTVMQMILDTLPFGGVGQSGMGNYHGRYSFETFSHKKAVLIRNFNYIMEWLASKRYPPYSDSNLKQLLPLVKKRNLNAFKYLKHVTFFLLGGVCYYFLQLFAFNYNQLF